jgi:hypothetical protein
MMHAVLKTPNDSLHLIGAVEPYNLESLAYHATSMQHGGSLDLCIWVTRDDEERLRREAGALLDRLAHDGNVVRVRSADSRRGI